MISTGFRLNSYLLAEGRPIVWIEPQATNLLPRPFQTSSFCHSDVTTKLSMKRPPALARDNPSQYRGPCKTPVHCCLHRLVAEDIQTALLPYQLTLEIYDDSWTYLKQLYQCGSCGKAEQEYIEAWIPPYLFFHCLWVAYQRKLTLLQSSLFDLSSPSPSSTMSRVDVPMARNIVFFVLSYHLNSGRTKALGTSALSNTSVSLLISRQVL